MNSVSIVIPTYNRADLLPDAIEACLQQTQKCEIIVCDHGSNDATPQIIANYGSEVTYIRREQDFGPHFCWLEGVLNASEDLVHLHYDDDSLEPTFIEELSNLFSADVGFAFSSAAVFSQSEPERYYLDDLFDETIVPTKKAEKKLLENLVSPGCAIFRKQDMIDGLYQGRLPLQNHDYHGVGPDKFVSLLCFLRYDRIAYVNKPLARFRAHEGSITMSAHADTKTSKKINDAYQEVNSYYNDLKLIQLLEKIKLRKRIK